MRFRSVPVAVGVLAALAASPSLASTFYVTTGVGSSEAVIDANNPISWTFTSYTPYTGFGGGVFAMKHIPDPVTTFGLQLEFFDVTNNTLYGVVPFSIADFINAGGNDSGYARVVLAMPYPYALSGGDQYRVTLSVIGDPHEDTGSFAVRGTLAPITIAETNDPTSIDVAIDPPTETPEPATALVLAAALAGLAGARRGAKAASA